MLEDILINEEFAPQLKEQVRLKKHVWLQIGTEKDKQFIVEARELSFELKSKGVDVSIQRKLANLFSIEYQVGYKFKETIKQLSAQEMEVYTISFVEICFKDQYVSRRDIRNIELSLENTVVYTNKVIYYQGIRVYITNLMQDNRVVSTGFITSATKKIYRSQSSRYTMLVEMNKEIFEFDGYGEIYWEKVLKFMRVFFARCHFFNSSHNVDVILYGRLCYPQFTTLHAAQEALVNARAMTANGINESHSSFEITTEGLVYQDVYRKCALKLGQKNIEKNLNLIWHAFNEFLAVINWTINANPITQKIISTYDVHLLTTQQFPMQLSQGQSSQSIIGLQQSSPLDGLSVLKHSTSIGPGTSNLLASEKAIASGINGNNPTNNNINKKESVHVRRMRRMERFPIECELSYGFRSNSLEALSMVAMSYGRQFQSRLLTETGLNIISITCGETRYNTDQGLYKMLKALLLLNDIRCTQVALRETYGSQSGTQIIYPVSTNANAAHRMPFEALDIVRKQEYYDQMLHHCIESGFMKERYISVEQLPKLPEVFRAATGYISLNDTTNNLKKIDHSQLEQLYPNLKLKCNHEYHYIIDEGCRKQGQNFVGKEQRQTTQPYWLCKCTITDEAMKCHELLYNAMTLDPTFTLQTKYYKEEFRMKEVNFMTVKVIQETVLQPQKNDLVKNVQDMLNSLIQDSYLYDQSGAAKRMDITKEINKRINDFDDSCFNTQAVQKQKFEARPGESRLARNIIGSSNMAYTQSSIYMNQGSNHNIFASSGSMTGGFNINYDANEGDQMSGSYSSFSPLNGSSYGQMITPPMVRYNTQQQPQSNSQSQLSKQQNVTKEIMGIENDNSNQTIFNTMFYERNSMPSNMLDDQFSLNSQPQSGSSQIHMTGTSSSHSQTHSSMSKDFLQDNVVEKEEQAKSHNRCRMEMAFWNQKIHWLQNAYEEKVKRDFESFNLIVDDTHFLKHATNTQSHSSLISLTQVGSATQSHRTKLQAGFYAQIFEIERFWKSIVTPILPPIFTNYIPQRYVKGTPQKKFHQEQNHFLEAIIGFRLSNNFQIIVEQREAKEAQQKGPKEVKLIRGNYCQFIKQEDDRNITLIDHVKNYKRKKKNEPKIEQLPSMIYKFLVIDDKSGRLVKKQQVLQNESIQAKLKSFDLLIGTNEEPNIASIINEGPKLLCIQINTLESYASRAQHSVNSQEKLRNNFENFLAAFKKHLLDLVRKNPQSKLAKVQEVASQSHDQSIGGGTDLFTFTMQPMTTSAGSDRSSGILMRSTSGISSAAPPAGPLPFQSSSEINGGDQYHEQTIFSRSFAHKEVNPLDFFIVQFQKNWSPDAVFRIHLYWLSFPSSLIAEYIKSVTSMARGNQMQMNYIRFINESIFRQHQGFDYSISVKLLSMSGFVIMKEFLFEHDFMADLTNPLILHHYKGIGSILLAPTVKIR